jgi:sialate O-acetylesterase
MFIESIKQTKLKILIIIFSFFISVSTSGKVELPKLISDGMVLQRNAEVKIWGWAEAGEKVSINFNGIKYATTTGKCGKWAVTLSNMKAGGPYNMEIKADNNIIIKDILVGDVWVCSGQSNMEISMKRVSPLYESEIANSENMYIRYFTVPKKYNFNTPQKDLEYGNWKKTNPENILAFSAVAYFFAKELYEKYHIPIGLINSSLGGSPIEAWISEESLKEFPSIYEEAQKFKDTTLISQIIKKDKERIGTWYNQLREKDKGYKNPEKIWYNPTLDESDWGTMKIPGYWVNTQLGSVNGVIWFRKEINIPAHMAGKQAKLLLGRIVDADSAFINGVFVGTTGYQYPPRRYGIPSGLLKEGKNILVVRVISNIGNGGFVLDKPYKLVIGGETIDLKGNWKYKLGAETEPLESQTFIRWKPLGLYNAMIFPLLNYRIKGVIWYQGESNAGEPLEYRKLFPALIKDWRENWNQGDFPFLFVQLHNFMETKEEPSESNWALLREAQLKTLAVPKTGMAVAIDIGEWNDIHPLNKQDVGRRLALTAQKIAYGEEDVVYSGPIYKGMVIKGNKIILTFTNIGGGLVVKDGGELNQFAICGADKKFVWAEAKIEDNKVIVWNDNINNPVAIRYAWSDNPEGANLYNKEGLPASPFRTDNE